MSAWLVDTHAVLWYLNDDQRLSDSAKRIMESRDSLLFVGAGSICEMAIKASLGKLEVPDDFVGALVEEGFDELPVTFAHAWRLRELPLGNHRDPFDRLLVAQALVEQLPVISNDAELDQYEVERRW